MAYSSKIMQRGWHGRVLSPGSVWRDKDEICAPDSQSWGNKESHGEKREADTQGSRSGIRPSVSSLCSSTPPCTAGPHATCIFPSPGSSQPWGVSLIWGRSRLAAHRGSQMHTLQDARQSGPRGWDTDGVKFSLLTADAELTALQQTPKVIVRCSFVEENDLRLSEAQAVTWGLTTAASAVLLYRSLLKTSPQILYLIFKPTAECINREVGSRQTWVRLLEVAL